MSRFLWVLVWAGLLVAAGCKEEEAPRKEIKQTRKMIKPGGK